MPRKKKEVSVPKAIEVSDGPQYLTQEEMHRFEIANLKLQLRKEQKKHLAVKRKDIHTTIEMLQEKINVQEKVSKLLDHDMVRLQQVTNEEVRAHREWFSSLKEKYGIDPDASFGHDPVSGEIVIS